MEKTDRLLKNYADVLSIEDLTKVLNIGKKFAYKLVQDKTIPAKKLGRHWIISKENLIKFILEE